MMWNKKPAHFPMNAVEYKSEMYHSFHFYGSWWRPKSDRRHLCVKCGKKSKTLNEWRKFSSLTNGIYDNIANIIKFLIAIPTYVMFHKYHSIL